MNHIISSSSFDRSIEAGLGVHGLRNIDSIKESYIICMNWTGLPHASINFNPGSTNQRV